ncbi:hypothetical protein FHL15_001463 [Xylaria flabelliformis]|uniref:PD-(D/E)XK nuclease-like domain-containing protein n=1 Tax=Xylaria flabelliformis TaxID=2512241 RepID=A0A553IBY7_9PEZI|nr:hypothetical protein FHL15_001463 [Xylaria flabelliformis]
MEVEPVTTATIIPDVTDTTFKEVDFCITIDRYEVIAISIETKMENASTTGEAQLTIWTKGWLNRMCLLSKKPKGTSPTAPPLPMLRIRNEDWYMLFAYYNNAGTEQQIGSTRDF